MPNRNLRAAADWEDECARLGRTVGGFLRCERERVRHPDRGDLGGVPEWTAECKTVGPATHHTPEAACARWYQAQGGATMSAQAAFMAGYAAGQKDGLRFDIAGAMDQLGKAQATRGTPYGVLLRKRPRATADRGYAMMPQGQFWAIARRLAECDAA